MCWIFTIAWYSWLVDIDCFRQVMRKKPEKASTSTNMGISNKLIAKSSGISPSTPKLDPGTLQSEQSRYNIQHTVSPLTTSGNGEPHVVDEDTTSNCGSRDRSITPLESDLLRYLTSHISPIDQEDSSDLCFGATSFVIGRDEYLHGIVRLVKSDCPEVTHDIQGFLRAMQQAFVDVNAADVTLSES